MAENVKQIPQTESIGDFLAKLSNPQAAKNGDSQEQNGSENQGEGQENGEEQRQQQEQGQEQEQQGEPNGQEDNGEFNNIFEIQLSDDKKETFDVFDDEQRDKLIEAVKNWKLNEEKIQKLDVTEASLNASESQMIAAIKLMYSQQLFGSMSEDNLMEKPFELYMREAGNDETKAMALLKEDRQKIQRTTEFANNFNQSAQKFVEAKSVFQKAHPEITNVDNWLRENLAPVIEPITSFGEKPISTDTLEMVYLWKNKDKVFKDIKDKALKEYAGRPSEKVATKKTIKNSNPRNLPQGIQQVEDAFKAISKKYEGRKVLINEI